MFRKIRWAALTVLAAAMLVQAAPAAAAPGQLVKRTFTNAAGTRTYYLYEPTSGGAGKPLMVWLHGCGGPGSMAAGHALSRVAEEKGFAIAYPIQTSADNIGSCWNWFVDGSMHRGAGEPSIIAGITTLLVTELGSDSSRVYVGGYSAGGAMTSVMGATYPDLYAAIAPSAGAPYGVYDVSGQLAYAEMGARARPVPAFILQGVTDEASIYLIGRANILQWLNTDDYADDGVSNQSVSRLPSSVTPQGPRLDLPAPLVVESYRQSATCELAQFVTSPLEHLLNGALLYYDPGLGLQRQMMGFLLAHRLGAPHQACG
jgi:poly(hydroxyalkanoate) depolymerase family esterase